MAPTLTSLAQEISASISNARELPIGTFACGGEIPIYASPEQVKEAHDKASAGSPDGTASGPVVLRWDAPRDSVDSEPAKVVFPVSSEEDSKGFEKLLRDSSPATFGLEGQHVLDETYRKAQKLYASAFSTSFNPYEPGIIDTWTIRAELYSLNIYSGPSGKFKAHVDTPRSTYQIGSLVACLPMSHKDGELAVRHDGKTYTFDWSDKTANEAQPSIKWAAFYSDCEHEVFEVTKGHRVTLTYNLYATRGNCFLPSQSALDPTSLPLYRQVKNLISSERFQSKGRLIGPTMCTMCFFLLSCTCSDIAQIVSLAITAHMPDPHTEKKTGLPFCLKGIDMAMYEAFRATGLTVRLCAVVDNPYSGWYGRRAWDRDLQEFSDSESTEKQGGVTAVKPKLDRRNYRYMYDSDEVNDDVGDDAKDVPSQLIRPICPLISAGMCEGPDDLEQTFENFGDRIDYKKVFWLNKKNKGNKKLQFNCIAYGNEPETREKYSQFALIVEAPAKELVTD
ncbi:Putative oxoglutarate/iron-dependent dioxygenase [Colletotrichum destructivum]|uniref:Oxoglutarate/iron-dependent dioxygenase n=1 Tax=Colletotrichum destructivum TaxID=34406 RepID=A0AAX4INB4_9PEZI|nr:Putative oxoglutarate/iron-dependent dioxygenase [Colletotrichum destructivum]